MSNFPLVRYKATDTWIPETDIDGTDANESILSEVNGIEFNNGFFENMQTLNGDSIPSNIQALLEEPADPIYELLSVKSFRHSEQGYHTVYILWTDLASDTDTPMLGGDLKIFLDDTELFLDEDSYGIEYREKPKNINYNLVNDQLKINLNCKASFVNPDTILNLTLIYMEEVEYNVDAKRAEGWYVRPRWLGYGEDYTGVFIYNHYPLTEKILEDFEDDNFIRNFELNPSSGVGVFVVGFPFGTLNSRMVYAENGTSNSRLVANFRITGLRNLKKIEFDIFYRGLGQLAVDGLTAWASLNVFARKEGDTKNHYFLRRLFDEAQIADNHIVVDMDFFAESSFNLYFSLDIPPKYDSTALSTIFAIDNLELFSMKSVMLGVTFDGQRSFITSGHPNTEYGLGMYAQTEVIDNIQIRVGTGMLDWRFASYEFYLQTSGDIYTLIGKFDVDGEGWTLVGNHLRKDIVLEDEDEDGVTTLNFKYNLPGDARVDHQRNIYSEIVHKGRVYFVNGDYKIYQGHISANLAIQADAFPYDEETGFGYLIVDQSKINLVLAVSPTNDMVIYTNEGIYVYFIQPSGSGVFRQLRLGSGSISIASRNSLTTVLNGDPATDGLFWCDNNGVYVYFGGLQPPENLITLTHKKYWDAIPESRKTNAVGFYNPARKEYWLSLGASGVMIYELPFKKWRYIGLSAVAEYCGLSSNGYVKLRMANSIFIMSPSSLRYNAIVVTHYNSCNYPTDERGLRVADAPERFHKILQELYLEFGDVEPNIQIVMQVYVDGRLEASYLFNSNKKIDKWLAPVGLKFGRIKLRLTLPSQKVVRIKEFGFSYVNDHKEPLAAVPIESAVDGYGYDYGQNYGVGL